MGSVDLSMDLKDALRVMVIGLSILFVTPVFAHGGEDGPMALELETSGLSAGANVLKFQIVDTVNNRLVSADDLLVVHEKKLHLFIYDYGLAQFRHLHPEPVAGSSASQWQVAVDLPVSGDYRVWIQGQVKGENEFSAWASLKVSGGLPSTPIPPVLEDRRFGQDGGSTLTLSSTSIHAARLETVELRFGRVDGSVSQITPYLGAVAHVVATGSDGDSLVHVHPMSTPTGAVLHVAFPEPGFYRLWVQFVDGGELRTIALSVEVVKRSLTHQN